MNADPHRDRDAVADSMIDRACRRGHAVPIRTSFVQQGSQSNPVPGPLARLVNSHDERALDLYLLFRAITSSDRTTDEWDVCFDARVWARGLGLPTPNNDGSAAVSKAWARLENRGLINRQRQGRLANVTLLNECGDGRAYTYPTGRGRGRYFKLSEQFWVSDQRWYRTLSLRAKAMLLIASSLKPGFVLPLEQAPRWYGVSPEVVSGGVRELRDHGLLKIDKLSREAPLSPTNYAVMNTYTLLTPFAQDWRTQTLATVTDIRGVAAGGT